MPGHIDGPNSGQEIRTGKGAKEKARHNGRALSGNAGIDWPNGKPSKIFPDQTGDLIPPDNPRNTLPRIPDPRTKACHIGI
jgi:hypothetical protein